jgi:hypothetical protein
VKLRHVGHLEHQIIVEIGRLRGTIRDRQLLNNAALKANTIRGA